MYERFNINVRDLPYDPDSDSPVILYRKQGDRILYRVYLYLEGMDLEFVRSVTYHLHHTFSNPVEKIKRSDSNPNCKLSLWMWGTFEVKAVIEDRKGRKYERSHFLEFDKFFNKKDIQTRQV